MEFCLQVCSADRFREIQSSGACRLETAEEPQTLTNTILRMGDYMRYQVSNCDLKGDRAYFFSHDIFPLALRGS